MRRRRADADHARRASSVLRGRRRDHRRSSSLDRITTTALANLLVAVTGDKLPNVCLVLTDLRSSVYSGGHAAMSEALSN
ncbi:MAG: hypothetical protein R3A46_05815 [Thermomicrobiales bacterium]